MRERITLIVSLMTADGSEAYHVRPGGTPEEKYDLARAIAENIVELVNDVSDQTEEDFKTVVSIESVEFLEE